MSRELLAGRDAYRHWQPVQTRWSDNDIYGHVNNLIYYAWFYLTVNGWLIENGLLDIAAGDAIGLVVETRCRYAASLSYPQPVEVGLPVERLGLSSVIYRPGVFAANAPASAAEGRFTHVYVDRANRRPSPLSAPWRAKLGILC